MKKIINYETIAYIFSSGIAFATDISIFSLLVNLLNCSIVLSAILARIISSLLNYLLNRNLVFKKDNQKFDKKSFIEYYSLVIIQLSISTILTLIFNNIIKINVTFIKIIIDVIIFIANYLIQKFFIFKKWKTF